MARRDFNNAPARLLSIGDSVRPRPLLSWLPELVGLEAEQLSDRVAKLNQLSLIAYFNGNDVLATRLSDLTIRLVLADGSIATAMLAIQPWINKGRILKSRGSWSDAKPYFMLPYYLSQAVALPRDFPVDQNLLDARRDELAAFGWSNLLIEFVSALDKGWLSSAELLMRLCDAQAAPADFAFAVAEARAIVGGDHEMHLLNQAATSPRQLAAYCSRVALLAFRDRHGDPTAELVQALAITQKGFNLTDNDCFLEMAALVVNSSPPDLHMLRPLLRWVTSEATGKRNELVLWSLASKHHDLISIRDNLARTSCYKRINPNAPDLSVEISKVARTLLW